MMSSAQFIAIYFPNIMNNNMIKLFSLNIYFI